VIDEPHVAPADATRVSAPVLIAAAGPVVLATLGVMVFVVCEMLGQTLSSAGPTRNLAEAAAIGNVSEVARFLHAGEDPNRIVEVRPYAVSSSIRRVTGLEAAVWHRSARLMKFFDQAGAIGHDEARRRLACLAADLRVDEIVEYLSPDGASSCVPGEVVADIEARSREP
jgi:hypothetical protein